MTGHDHTDRHTCAAALAQIAERLEAYAVFQDRPAARTELEQIATEVRAVTAALLAAGQPGAAPTGPGLAPIVELRPGAS